MTTEAIRKIIARRAVVAETYASLMRWAITVEYVPAGTSTDIDDFYSLPRGVYEGAVEAGLTATVAEYKGLTDALGILATDD